MNIDAVSDDQVKLDEWFKWTNMNISIEVYNMLEAAAKSTTGYRQAILDALARLYPSATLHQKHVMLYYVRNFMNDNQTTLTDDEQYESFLALCNKHLEVQDFHHFRNQVITERTTR